MVLRNHVKLQRGGESEYGDLVDFSVAATTPSVRYLFQEFTLTDDNVLQEHYEDPRLVQMTLLGSGGE